MQLLQNEVSLCCSLFKSIKHVNEIAALDSGSDDYFLATITSSVDTLEEWTAGLLVGNSVLTFKIDTGADITVIPHTEYDT